MFENESLSRQILQKLEADNHFDLSGDELLVVKENIFDKAGGNGEELDLVMQPARFEVFLQQLVNDADAGMKSCHQHLESVQPLNWVFLAENIKVLLAAVQKFELFAKPEPESDRDEAHSLLGESAQSRTSHSRKNQALLKKFQPEMDTIKRKIRQLQEQIIPVKETQDVRELIVYLQDQQQRLLANREYFKISREEYWQIAEKLAEKYLSFNSSETLKAEDKAALRQTIDELARMLYESANETYNSRQYDLVYTGAIKNLYQNISLSSEQKSRITAACKELALRVQQANQKLEQAHSTLEQENKRLEQANARLDILNNQALSNNEDKPVLARITNESRRERRQIQERKQQAELEVERAREEKERIDRNLDSFISPLKAAVLFISPADSREFLKSNRFGRGYNLEVLRKISVLKLNHSTLSAEADNYKNTAASIMYENAVTLFFGMSRNEEKEQKARFFINSLFRYAIPFPYFLIDYWFRRQLDLEDMNANQQITEQTPLNVKMAESAIERVKSQKLRFLNAVLYFVYDMQLKPSWQWVSTLKKYGYSKHNFLQETLTIAGLQSGLDLDSLVKDLIKGRLAGLNSQPVKLGFSPDKKVLSEVLVWSYVGFLNSIREFCRANIHDKPLLSEGFKMLEDLLGSFVVTDFASKQAVKKIRVGIRNIFDSQTESLKELDHIIAGLHVFFKNRHLYELVCEVDNKQNREQLFRSRNRAVILIRMLEVAPLIIPLVLFALRQKHSTIQNNNYYIYPSFKGGNVTITSNGPGFSSGDIIECINGVFPAISLSDLNVNATTIEVLKTISEINIPIQFIGFGNGEDVLSFSASFVATHANTYSNTGIIYFYVNRNFYWNYDADNVTFSHSGGFLPGLEFNFFLNSVPGIDVNDLPSFCTWNATENTLTFIEAVPDNTFSVPRNPNGGTLANSLAGYPWLADVSFRISPNSTQSLDDSIEVTDQGIVGKDPQATARLVSEAYEKAGAIASGKVYSNEQERPVVIRIVSSYNTVSPFSQSAVAGNLQASLPATSGESATNIIAAGAAGTVALAMVMIPVIKSFKSRIAATFSYYWGSHQNQANENDPAAKV